MGERTFSRNLSVFSFREMEKYAHNLCLNHAVLLMIVFKEELNSSLSFSRKHSVLEQISCWPAAVSKLT